MKKPDDTTTLEGVGSTVGLDVSLTRYEQIPKKAEVNEGDACAWWYAMRDHIELHIDNGSSHYVVRLPLAKLKDYVLRMSSNR